MSQTKVLVGFAEALAAPEVVWSLVDAGFRVEAFARRGRASALRHSKHTICHDICPPESDIQQSLLELQSLVDSVVSQEADSWTIVFPLDDTSVWLCSRMKSSDSWLLAGPSGSRADLALVKHLQVAAAREAGFEVPNTALVKNTNEVFAFCGTEAFPVILKADECIPLVQGRAYSCRKWICANRAELDRAVNEWQERVPLLAQSFITGVGEGVFGLVAQEGVRAWSGHHRVRMMNPQGSGSSACESQSVSEDVKHYAHKMMTSAGWNGLFMLELLRDERGGIWFVELNGRPWGSMALCRRQGLEYPAWHVQLARNQSSPAGMNVAARPEIVCRHAGREFMHMLFVLRGARSNALNRWPSFWKTAWEMLHFRKQDGIYNWRWDDKKVFLADFYYTIHSNVFKGRN